MKENVTMEALDERSEVLPREERYKRERERRY